MKDALLDRKIKLFLARKSREHEYMAQPVNTLTRELDADQVASPLHTYAKEVYQHDARQSFRGHHTAALRYAL
jgi:hypothetical protein